MFRPQLVAVLGWTMFSALACGGSGETKTLPQQEAPAPAAAPRPVSTTSNQTILFLEARLKNDPDDYIAHNKLASAYLQQIRETGDITFLDLALKAAKSSLAILPAETNPGGLAALAAAEFSAHEFTDSRDHAARLAEIDRGKGYVYLLLGDALIELGQYDEAKLAFNTMEELGGVQASTRVAIEQRLSRLAALYGDTKKARIHMSNAFRIASQPPGLAPETIAFCQWQLGRMSFSSGDYTDAEKHFAAALATQPEYFAALASMAQVQGARGDLSGAIDKFERATQARPDPAAIAALGDLYRLAGRDADASRQYALLDKIAEMSAKKGNIYNRELSMFYANHDLKAAEACEAARKEYETRRDIYGADAVAWTCYKAGRTEEARAAILDALRLGTKDAQLFYHAGMIEKAAGNKREAKTLLEKALKLNPSFDLLQSEIARAALLELKSE